MEKQEMGLYLHIPFCMQKCAYCDFLSWADSPQKQEMYVQALVKEIQSYKEMAENYRVPTVFLGGGTPSILASEQTARIMEALHEVFSIEQDAEITTEANPGTVDKEKLCTYRSCGMNRISFGLQSAEEADLKMLGRIHSWETFLESYEMARNTGFSNMNVDLISAIPGQSAEAWRKNLEKVTALEPEHISAYSLIVEEGTPFYEMQEKGVLSLPDEEEERQMYEDTGTMLQEAGYQQYEISNYAKPGMECRHNCSYWKRKNYLGLGLGSASLLENRRFHNTRDWTVYMENSGHPVRMREEEEVLSVQEQMEEFMFLGLRMTDGISGSRFYQLYGKTVEEVYGPVIDKYETMGFLGRAGDRIFLSRAGISVSNVILSEFLL
ncbi:MAG: radical SAM family heme chaperone HemW [Lachnospiraceae bacterium]|jgi:oxygen-independent coproporphyrinogen-3 oxidase